MIEKILILEDGERWIDELDELDRSELENSNFFLHGLEDPVTLSVFLFTAKFQKNGYSWKEIMEAVCFDETYSLFSMAPIELIEATSQRVLVEGKDVERAIDKLLDCELLTGKWVKENGKWEFKFFNNWKVAKYFAKFSYAATERQLKAMSGGEIAKHWFKLTKHLHLVEL